MYVEYVKSGSSKYQWSTTFARIMPKTYHGSNKTFFIQYTEGFGKRRKA